LNVLRGVGQEREVPGPLEGHGQHALVTGAGAGLAAGVDLAAVRHITAELGGFFVVNMLDLVDAKGTDATPAKAAAATPAGSFRPCAWLRGSRLR
jgi:hypothetical protein